jgi:DNA-binding NarL/FixJ family response regulator
MTSFGSESIRPGTIERPVRVLIADDHPLTRMGIRCALDGGGFEVCAEVDDADAAVTAALRERPDLCLLDVHMPGDGIKAADRIAVDVPDSAVVMISASVDDDSVFAALRAGAVGFLSKDMAFVRLPDALHGVLNGEAALTREVTARLLEEFCRTGGIRRLQQHLRPGATLTRRETDVLEILLNGHGTAAIGERLRLSRPTVRTHIAALMRKFGVRDRDTLRALFTEPASRLTPAVRSN